MSDGKQMDPVVITLDPEVYAELNLCRALDSKKNESDVTWNQFFNNVVASKEREANIISWAYTLGIFFLVTLVLTIPIYLLFPSLEMVAASIAVFTIPMAIIGLVVALFTAYVLTPIFLRHQKPYEEDPQVQQYLDKLAEKSGLSNVQLLVEETPEVNAMAYNSPWGGRVCLTSPSNQGGS